MPEVAAVVFYDLPLNPTVLEARIGRFVRIGRKGPIQIVGFTDEADVLVIERLQRRIAEAKETLSEQEIEKALFFSEDK
jgi:superfamily II DNA/RNA helicase